MAMCTVHIIAIRQLLDRKKESLVVRRAISCLDKLKPHQNLATVHNYHVPKYSITRINS